MKNKKIILCLSTVLVISLITTGCGTKVELEKGDKVAVSVKGGKITATEYYNKIKTDNVSELVDMIDHELFDEKYPTDDTENKSVDDQISTLKTNYGSDESTFNSVIQQYFGVNNEDELKEMLHLEYKRNLAVEDYIKDNIKDDEIQKYYDENITGDMKASHILISASVSSDATEDEKTTAEEEAKKEAEKVIKQLNNGKKFATLAKKYSDDTATAKNGGDLGYFKSTEMVEEFTNAVKDLEVNEYTKEPVKTQYGYHIILKTGQKDKAKLKTVKDSIKETLTTNKLNDDATLHYQTLIDIREANNIKWTDSELKKQYNEFMDQLMESAKTNAQSASNTTAS